MIRDRRYTKALTPRRGLFARLSDFFYLRKLPMKNVHQILIKRELEKSSRIARKYKKADKTKFVVIEGLDGIGKATITEEFRKLTFENNPHSNNVVIDYPNYASWSSIFVKRYLRGKINKDPRKVSPKVAAFCYAFDRWIDYHKRVKQYRREGYLIIYDRYSSSNMLFQGAKLLMSNKRHGRNKNTLSEINQSLLELEKWILLLEHVIFGIPFVKTTIMLTMTERQYRDIVLTQEFRQKHGHEDIHEKSNFLLEVHEVSGKIADMCRWKAVSVAVTKKGYRYARWSQRDINERVSIDLVVRNIYDIFKRQ